MTPSASRKFNLRGLIWFLIVFIITVPAFSHILNGQYFSMHDDQQIARLYLLDQGIRQGNLYPRWVDVLGFGYGYPLFNFYPPLVYYVGEFFHLLGMSLIWSIKMVFIAGFVISAWGTYLFSRKFMGKIIALVPAVLYTYFFYHAVNAYVRGALAEFFSMAILPFVFLAIKNLFDERTLKNALFFGLALSLLILDHPLIAFPSLIFIGSFFVFYFIVSKKNNMAFAKLFAVGAVLGLGLSAFFWLPSLIEKKYTYVDKILTHDLANYAIHFIYPQQFWYSLWGYGGSIAGPNDGMTFQLGKIQIFLFIAAVILSMIYIFKIKKNAQIREFMLFAGLTLFSLFMTVQASIFVWKSVSYLAYLQFPWRFLTFAGFFMSVVCGYGLFFAQELLKNMKNVKKVVAIIVACICVLTIGIYGKYFKPQFLRNVTDASMTSFDEIAWNVSSTSFEFVPQGIRTARTSLGTTTLAISEHQLPKTSFQIPDTQGYGKQLINKFEKKTYFVHALTPMQFTLNTYDFPGWNAYLKDLDSGKTRRLKITGENDLRLITVTIPEGTYEVDFIFQNTMVRTLAEILSIISLGALLYIFNKNSR